MNRMKALVLLAPITLACATLLSACSSEPQSKGSSSSTESSFTSVGSYIPHKKSSGPSALNAGTADMQALENSRNNGNGVMNLPVK